MSGRLNQPHPISPKPKRRSPPYSFVLEALASLNPEVRPMFSGYSVYVGDNIVCMLRDRPNAPEDNGIWLVFADPFDTSDDPKALRHEFPSIRPIQLLQGKIRHWLILGADAPNFESESMHFCDLLLARDPRLGRIPESRKTRNRSRIR